MSEYVEKGYSEDYVEGDTQTPSGVVSCDLTNVENELSLIKSQNEEIKVQNQEIKAQNLDLNNKLDAVLSAIQVNKTLDLNIVDKVTNIESKVNAIPSSHLDISGLATKEYIDNSIPFVDDTLIPLSSTKGIKVFPPNTEVSVVGVDGICTVVSSHFLPVNDFDYTVIYSVSQDIDGVAVVSNMLSSTCVKYVEPEVT